MEDHNIFLILSESLKWSVGFSKSQGGKAEFSADKHLLKTPYVNIWLIFAKDCDFAVCPCSLLYLAINSNILLLLYLLDKGNAYSFIVIEQLQIHQESGSSEADDF